MYEIGILVIIAAVAVLCWKLGYNRALCDIARKIADRMPLTEKDAKKQEGQNNA
jgi:hypothetical protein